MYYLPHILLAAFGLLYATHGFALLKRLMVGLGACAGMVGGCMLGAWLDWGNSAYAICAVVGAGIGAGLCLSLFAVGFFLVGLLSGLIISPTVLPWLRLQLDFLPQLAAVILASVLLGIVTAKLRGAVYIFFSAAVGSFLAVLSLEMALLREPRWDLHAVQHAYANAMDRRWWLFGALCFCGIAWQIRSRLAARAREKAAAQQEAAR